MYDSKFNLLGYFSDPSAPSKKTVYGIQNIKDKLYVTYAAFTPMQGGAVDVFDTDGNFLQRLITDGPEGPTQGPWGLALAPSDFGPFSNALLVGSVGDGHINAFEPSSGAFLGTMLNQQTHRP
jgi:uncharacterized protein (TIGR03118 family)